MKKNKELQFPAEEVTLPSKGLLYSEDSPLRSGKILMKYMTAREEDILTNQNFIANGTVIDKLLKSLIVSDINYNELLIGDKNAVMVAARILGYGADYEFKYRGETHTIDLAKIKDKELDESIVKNGQNEFEFTLPTSKIPVTFKLLTHKDEMAFDKEIKGLKKLNKNFSNDLSTRMKYVLLSVNGDYEKQTIRKFVDNEFLARDARELRNYINKIQPSVDLSFEYEDSRGNLVSTEVPIGIEFFWPDASV
jgi:hypothetical protein